MISHFIYLLLLFPFVLCASNKPGLDQAESIDAKIDNLARRITQNPLADKELQTRAMTVLESLKPARSCDFVATSALIDSCQSLETFEGGEETLEEVRKKFAVSLAVCDLEGAKAPIPPQCAMFTTHDCKRPSTGTGFFSRRAKRHEVDSESKACIKETTTKQLEDCLSALHAISQSWTSYNHALYNVRAVCHASRHLVEKGKIIERFINLMFFLDCFNKQ
jgi:Tht1-like nuclear fusion protein